MPSVSTIFQTSIRILRSLPCRPLPPGFKILPDDEDDDDGDGLTPSNGLLAIDTDKEEPDQVSTEEEEEEEDYMPTDPITLCNEFDRTNAINDLRRQLERAGFTDIEVVPISLRTAKAVVERLSKEAREKRRLGHELVVFQLCDGTELDGYPGLSVVRLLEKHGIPFTGADSGFYRISNSKPVLKRVLQAANVNTSTFQEFLTAPKDTLELEPLIAAIGFPMIVKPSISYASLNITMASVVHSREQLLEQIKVSLDRAVQDNKDAGSALAALSLSPASAAAPGVTTISDATLTPNTGASPDHPSMPPSPGSVLSTDLATDDDFSLSSSTTTAAAAHHHQQQHHQHHLHYRQQPQLQPEPQRQSKEEEVPSVFVEKFLAGREFTALLVGDEDWGVRVYPVAERAFDPKLGRYERLLAFDQYWDGYDLQGGQGNEDFCRYEYARETWQPALQQIAKNAYLALHGNGYGRVDIRTTEMDVCDPVVLEVNANCGLSFEKDSSSMANILLMAQIDPPGFVHDLIEHALHRQMHRVK
ncbi:hypothetical protein DFQ27_008358 [Actinomortierella ambigua]|uniref:D-alanine--D-alanine ligase C-terminal domain-containing protein n=1 Tax=Actinomortierella ambigua TaxID=1343610 RepID=A0A9P6QJ80_9FUNG|nr:hypothetical protein DFQ27_008358 [Actinomortierella ambigua]